MEKYKELIEEILISYIDSFFSYYENLEEREQQFRSIREHYDNWVEGQIETQELRK